MEIETISGSYPPGSTPLVHSYSHKWLLEHPEVLNEKSLNLTYRPIDHSDLPELKLIQQELFPITYNDTLYSQLNTTLFSMGCYLTHPKHQFGELPMLVGCILFRIEANGKNSHIRWTYLFKTTYSCYVITIGVLKVLRGKGIAKTLLNYCKEFTTAHEKQPLYIALHVAEYNEEAIPFYKNYGFDLVEVIDDHYYINGDYYGAYYYIYYLEHAKKPVLTWKNLSAVTRKVFTIPRCFNSFKFFKDS